MRAIIKLLPQQNRQTALFSATQTQNVADLARLAIQHKPVYVAAQQTSDTSTVQTLEQGFVVCESQNRFLLLFTFLKKNRNKKVIVFFSSCNSVKYHSELLNYIDRSWTCTATKSRTSAPPHSSTSARRRRVSSYVPTSRHAGSIFRTWTGSSSSTRRMSPRHTSIVSAARRALVAAGALSSSCCHRSSPSSNTSSKPRCELAPPASQRAPLATAPALRALHPPSATAKDDTQERPT